MRGVGSTSQSHGDSDGALGIEPPWVRQLGSLVEAVQMTEGREMLGALVGVALSSLIAACSTSAEVRDDSSNNTTRRCQEHSECGRSQRCLQGLCRSSAEYCHRELPGCSPALAPDQCVAAGGEVVWLQGVSTCRCLRNDDGCPCWPGAACSRGICMADSENCTENVVGRCRFFPGRRPMGCGCYLAHGGFQWICAN